MSETEFAQIDWRESAGRLYAEYLEGNRNNTEFPMESAAEFWSLSAHIADDDIRMLLRLNEWMAKELARGKRCGVCGNTPAQSAAIGYNCSYEC